jgi:hypothetical protein
MTEQEKRIGAHPTSDIFSTWLTHEDLPTSDAKKHRKLSENISERGNAVEKLARWIIQHHVIDANVKRWQQIKQDIYKKHDFEKYITKALPSDFTTQKGNATEILLSEYLKNTSALEWLIFKLRYSSLNIDQALKGDDILLFDKKNLKRRVILGESKYRTKPTTDVIEDILYSMGGEIRFPISIHFVSDRLRELGNEDLGNDVADLAIYIEGLDASKKAKNDFMVNIGFLLSNVKAENYIQGHHLLANFVITQPTIDVLIKNGFPTSHIESLKSRIFRTESKLIEEIKKQLEKVNKKNKKDGIKGKDIDIKDLIEKNQNVIFQYCDKSHNPELVFLSLGIDNPEKLIELSFQRANEILKDEIESVVISH